MMLLALPQPGRRVRPAESGAAAELLRPERLARAYGQDA